MREEKTISYILYYKRVIYMELFVMNTAKTNKKKFKKNNTKY